MYRILIVEDDATMAKAMKTQIDSWGNQAETVKDFQNVISAFLNFDPSYGINGHYAAFL